MRYVILVALFALSLAGCSEPTLNGSTDETLTASIAEVRAALPEDQRAAFDQAMVTVVMKDVFTDGLQVDAAAAVAKARLQITGKTGQEVIAQAAAIRDERAAKEREQAVAEIAELREKRDSAAKAAAELRAFRIERSRFAQREEQYMGRRPVIELTVVNGTPHAIARAFFIGTVASPGRSVPWIKEDFNYSISGGLEPGERATWSLAPNMFSKWATDVPDDAVLTVEVTRLDGADGKPVIDAEGLSEREAKRLEELEKQFGT